MPRKKRIWILSSLALAVFLGFVLFASSSTPAPASAYVSECQTCHNQNVTAMSGGKHATLQCEACHEGSDVHLAAPTDVASYPKVHFDQEVCYSCHQDQYNTYEIADRGKTYYGGSDNSATPPKGWSKTKDLPFWNVLIDGHPFVLETYEDSPMSDNQIEHQETIRPGSEACLECHGTKVAYYMGIQYMDANGNLKTENMPNGLPREQIIKSGAYTDPVSGQTGHLIYDGTSHQDPVTGAWLEARTDTFVPNGTRVSTYTDAASGLYQVKTLVTLPAVVTQNILDKYGAVVGSVTFQTVASYPEAGADINGQTGFSPPATADGNVATVARDWIYATLEAMAFDGLDYAMSIDPADIDHFLLDKSKMNWPSVQSGELCNQCHDPHSGKLRLIKKSLIAAIAQRGINPYAATKVYDFSQATRQDQIIAVCGQCHSEYVGGYSANTKLDQDYFPWAKPADLENQYTSLFGYLQDWTHGGPIAPWQSTDSNARGFLPYGQRYPINAPLVKVQHPEAEEFFASPMYNAGATCTDCHSVRMTRTDGTKYTSHWFASPLKLMQGFTGQTTTGVAISMPAATPCQKCHAIDTVPQSQAKIKGQQDTFFVLQERTQVALVNALKFIKEQQDLGFDQTANIQTYQRAAMRWEYYTQAENSMSFHNNPEATTEVSNARLWVDAFIPWPLTPVNTRITGVGADTLTLAFYDQANDETGFIVERATALEGPYSLVATLPTTNGANIGDMVWTDTGLASLTAYFYRVAAYNAAGTSVYGIWATGTTLAPAIAAPTNLTATPISSSQINLSWVDNATNETGYRIERAKDAGFTLELVVFSAAAGAQTFNDTGLATLTTYYYRVFAINAGGSSSPSNTASATTLAAPPAAPSMLVVRSVIGTSITIGWKDNSVNETGFYVERSTDGKVWTRITTLGANTTSFTDSGLARRKTFWYRVQAFNASGASAYSNVVSAKTK